MNKNIDSVMLTMIIMLVCLTYSGSGFCANKRVDLNPATPTSKLLSWKRVEKNLSKVLGMERGQLNHLLHTKPIESLFQTDRFELENGLILGFEYSSNRVIKFYLIVPEYYPLREPCYAIEL